MANEGWRTGGRSGETGSEERIVHLAAEEARLARAERLRRTTEARRAEIDEFVTYAVERGEDRRLRELLRDPEPQVRLRTVEALREAEGRRWHELVVTVLDDPIDEVRAASVVVLAELPQHLPDLIPLLASPRWPATADAVLDALPGLIRGGGGLDESELSSLLQSSAVPPAPPPPEDRPRLADLVGAVGRDELIEALAMIDERRLGAVRLLMAEGSDEALRAVAGLRSDPIEEIRVAARAAERRAAGRIRIPEAEPESTEPGLRVSVVDEDAEIEQLAGTLMSPDPALRDRALADLGRLDWDRVLTWVRRSLRGGDREAAVLAANVAERLMLSSVAPSVLQRAASLPDAARGPFVGALLSFDLGPEELVGTLEEVEARHRPAAVRLLWRIGGRGILPHLRARLADASGGIRSAALAMFVEAEDPDSIEVAEEVLASDPSAEVRVEALDVLAQGDPATRKDVLERAREDPHAEVRAAAIRVLAPGLGEDAKPALLAALEDADGDVRGEAVDRLLAFVHVDPETVWEALRRASKRERRKLIEGLEAEGPGPLSDLALEHIGSPDPADRALAVRLCRAAGTQSCVQAAMRALQDPEPIVRVAAARVLADGGDPAALPALGAGLRDPDPEVRTVVIDALAGVDDEAVLEPLVGALRDPDPSVRDVVKARLAGRRSHQLARLLASALEEAEVREPAAELLAGMGHLAVDLLIDALVERGSGDGHLVQVIGRALARITDIGALAADLRSIEPSKRHRAVEAIAAIGGSGAVDALVRTLGDPDVSLRLRALHRLGDLEDPGVIDAIQRVIRSDPVHEVAEVARHTLERLGATG